MSEQLRRMVLEGIDGVLNAPAIVRRRISAEQMRLLRAQRRLWAEAEPPIMNLLVCYYDSEPMRSADDASGESGTPGSDDGAGAGIWGDGSGEEGEGGSA